MPTPNHFHYSARLKTVPSENGSDDSDVTASIVQKFLIYTVAFVFFTTPCSAQLSIGGNGNPIFDWNHLQLSEAPKPFEYFSAEELVGSTDWIINAYLLSYLSDRVYDNTPGGFDFNQAWVDELDNELAESGLALVDFIVDPNTSTEVAVMQKHGALLIVFRGSSGNGSNSNAAADWLADLEEEVVQQRIGSTSVFVHFGFWKTSSSVYERIRRLAASAHADGKKIWLAGHSLGGANATLTAARLHYTDNVPVEGLHTFGSPRVGDAGFLKLFDRPGAGGQALADISKRWVVNGDYATNLFNQGSMFQWRYSPWWGWYPRWFYVTYHHVGQTNTILALQNGFQFVYNTGENRHMPASLSSLNDGEHGWYTPALEFELSRMLTDEGSTLALESLLSLP